MRPSPWILRLPGVLLLSAAALKLWGLGVDPVGRSGWLATPEAQLAIIEFEVALGIWLLSGKNVPVAWLAACATFIAFAGVSLYLGLIGETSCGCAGRLVSMSPWVAFGIDLTVLGFLGLGWRQLTWRAEPREGPVADGVEVSLAASLAPVALGIAGVALLSAIVLGLAYASFGSLPAAIAHFRGERLSVKPTIVDLGQAAPGDRCRTIVELTNWTPQPIRVIGGTSDCSCTVLEELPLTIPKFQTRSIIVELSTPNRPGTFARQIAVLFEDQGIKFTTFAVTGRNVESP